MPIEFRPRSRVNAASTYLSKFGRNVTSQDGEDGIVEKIFEIIGTSNRHCLEIGAYDGKVLSNTWNLIVNEGWSGILIEGRTMLFEQLERRFSAQNSEIEGRFAGKVKLLHEYAGFEEHSSLDALLARGGAPRDIDFVSIDIDSNDWYLWEGLTQYRPRVVMIEFNATVPNDVYFVQERDFNVNQGCSLLALIDLGKRKGYELVATSTANAFFVQAGLFAKFGIEDNDIDSMYFNGHLLTRLFQGYDGELLLAGYQQLHWPNFPFTSRDIQVLPKTLRQYGMMFVDSQMEVRSEMSGKSSH